MGAYMCCTTRTYSAVMEATAIGLLKRAIVEDTGGRFTQALVCYQEGIQLLMDVRKATTDDGKKIHLLVKIKQYMERAEKLKCLIEEQKEDIHEQIHIENDAIGFSYAKIFNRFIDATLTSVQVEDPYVRNVHQIYNFLRFCELMVTSHSCVSRIELLTGQDESLDNRRQQESRLSQLGHSLKLRNIALIVSYSDTLHDREIRFSNGWVIKIGRGLDYFKAPTGKFAVGYCDFDLRPCHSTTVDIFHRTRTKSSKIVCTNTSTF